MVILIIFYCCSDRNETFDAIVIEQLWFQCFYSLVQHYNYPVLVGFLSVGNLPYAMDSVGKFNSHVLITSSSIMLHSINYLINNVRQKQND